MAVCLLHAVALVGCMPTYHTIPRYRYDRQAAAALEARASAWCAAEGYPSGVPELPFITDGCSLWPDGRLPDAVWQECCVTHDIAYWCGGSPARRAAADRTLGWCVADAARIAGVDDHLMGFSMFAGVRLMGHPWWPTYYRWGYGHRYPAPYYGLVDADRER